MRCTSLGVAGHLSITLRWGIPLSAFSKGTTRKLTGLLHIVPLMLNVKQGSCKYQFSSHWFDPTRNRTPSLPIQKQTLYTLGHLISKIIKSAKLLKSDPFKNRNPNSLTFLQYISVARCQKNIHIRIQNLNTTVYPKQSSSKTLGKSYIQSKYLNLFA